MQRVFFMESLEHWPIAKCEKSCNRPYRSRKFVHSIKHFCNSLLESLTVKQWHLNELIFTSDEITRLEFWLNVWFFSFERVHRSCHDLNENGIDSVILMEHEHVRFEHLLLLMIWVLSCFVQIYIIRSNHQSNIFFLSLNERIEICQRERLTKREKNVYHAWKSASN